jgi:hypothetical protein
MGLYLHIVVRKSYLWWTNKEFFLTGKGPEGPKTAFIPPRARSLLDFLARIAVAGHTLLGTMTRGNASQEQLDSLHIGIAPRG